MIKIDILDVIDKKAKGLSLTEQEINYFVKSVVDGTAKDYQSAALLMAIKINGLDDEEVVAYAKALITSGKMLPLQEDLVDKHSTGGVGDKTSLVLLPVLGAMGMKVFKLSGRGLGFTGGTIDKLESMKGFNGELTIDELNDMVDEIGISISAQTPDLTPADGILYALRDVTATVESLPLIAASIIAKKIASGAKHIVIDLKVGTGAFVKNLADAKELARLMKLISIEFDRELFVIYSSMDQPLGYMAGNKIEVSESVDFLNGIGAKDLQQLVMKIATELYSKVKGVEISKAELKYKEVIKKGTAAALQKKWFEAHGVKSYEKATKLLAKHVHEVKAPEEGFITFKSVSELGRILVELGAGRKEKDDKLDYNAGIVFKAKAGEKVKAGDTLCIITSVEKDPSTFEEDILANYEFHSTKPKVELILGELPW